MGIDKVALSGKVHRFHFVLRSELKAEICWIGAKYGLSLHDTIVFMLKTMYPVMVKYHFTGEEADGKPAKVEWDTKTHINLDLNFFKRIKMLHAQMHVFSIAIIVRRMLMLFVKYYRRGGLRLVRKLIYRFERIYFKNYKKSQIFDKRKIQTQLSSIPASVIKYIVTFNQHYQLLTTKLLK